MIKEIKVKTFSAGVTSSAAPSKRGKIQALEITIVYEGNKKNQYAMLKADGKSYKGYALGTDFFVIITNRQYHLFNENGKLVKEFMRNDGELIQIDKIGFAMRKDKMVAFYYKDGKLDYERELTEEELKGLDAKN